VPLVVLTMLAAWPLARAAKRFAEAPAIVSSGRPSACPDGWWRIRGALAVACAVLFAPILLIRAATTPLPASDHFATILRSAGMSALAAALALMLACPAAWWWRRAGRKGQAAGWALALGLLAIPGPLWGLAFLQFWHHPAWIAVGADRIAAVFADGFLAIPLAVAGRISGLALVAAWAAFRAVPEDGVAAASTLGADGASVFWRIGVRGAAAGLALAWAVLYVAASGDVAATVLATPPRWDGLAMQYATQIHFGVDESLARLLAWSLPMAGLPAGAAAWLALRRRA